MPLVSEVIAGDGAIEVVLAAGRAIDRESIADPEIDRLLAVTQSKMSAVKQYPCAEARTVGAVSPRNHRGSSS